MAAILSISAEALEQILRELEQIIVESRKLNDRTHNIVDKLSSSWTGDKMDIFADKIMASCHDEEQKIQILQQLSEYIRQAIQTYSQTESSLVESIRGLFKP